MPPQAANSVTNGPDGVDGDRRPQRILASLAPKIMHTRIVNSPSFQPSHYRSLVPAQNGFDTQSTLRNIARTRLLLPETWGGRTKTTATELLVSDPNRIAELLGLEVPAAGPASNRRSIQDGTTSTPPIEVSLIAGFKATVPSASEAKQRRRNRRAGLGSQVLGLDDEAIGQMQSRVNRERGLLTAVEEDDFEREGGVGRRKSTPSGLEARKARKARRQTALGLTSSNGSRPSRASNADLAVPVDLSLPELRAELDEIALDRAHLSTRKSLLAADREAVEAQIAKFSNLRAEIDRQLLALKEEDLELVDEEEGVVERIESLEADLPVANGTTAQTSESAIPPGNASSGRVPSTSRRRKGPAFLPSSHDALPSSTAFLTLRGHSSPLTALDFSSPYGTLVSASTDETVRLWDLTNGDEIGRLKGHEGVVKCLQVEGSVAVTGGQDGNIRVWDLEKAEEEAETQTAAKMASNKSSDGARTPIPDGRDDGLMREGDLGSIEPVGESEGSCMMRLSGHAQAVTSLYFDANTLVTGSSDKTLRQWDLTTGQVVLTMDILWAMQNPAASMSLTASPPPSPSATANSHDPFAADFAASPSAPPRTSPTQSPYPWSPYGTPAASPVRPRATRSSLGGLRRLSSGPLFGGSAYPMPTPPLSDGSWDMYQDFVGGVQFWGYALASGSGDGCVRMWDMRTGQAHRTLVGHTAPVTCLQFDELHLVSGSLDRSIRVWDLRTGAIADTLRFEHPITAVQFDSRKIIAAAGENGVRVFNRTTLQQTSLTTNGHTSPVERLRYVDRYMVTGSRDCTVKTWSI